MNRPYIICHMVTSIDSKVTGGFLYRKECEDATGIYYEINRNTESNGFICGRVTMESSFTNKWFPQLDNYDDISDRNDYIPPNLSRFYAVAFDTFGKLGWKSAFISDEDSGYDKAQIVEVLSEAVDNRYLGYLQSLHIPYIFAGKTEIDVEVALSKLNTLLNCDVLLLEGGSIINASFEKADAIDELSLVVAPIIAGNDSKPLFFDSIVADYELSKVETHGDVIVMKYCKVR